MPLQLGGIETMRPQVVTWDPNVYEEATEARQLIAKLKDDGFSVHSETEGTVVLKPPEMDPNKGVFCVLTDNGDDRIVWDRRNSEEVKDAYREFKRYIDEGYKAYVVRSDGSRGHKITDFDYALEEIIFGKRDGGNDVPGRGIAGEAGGTRRGAGKPRPAASAGSRDEPDLVGRGPAGKAVLVPPSHPG